jgi:hypothetical protein
VPPRKERRLKFKAVLSVLAMLVICGVLSSCQEVVNNPAPHISSLSPATATAGATGFTMTVNGSGFAPQSLIVFNGNQRVGNTLFLSQTQLTTLISPSDIANPGIIVVEVSTPSPGGGVTGTLNFTIVPGQSQTPQATSISPATSFAGGPGFTLSVFGTNFNSTSVVTLNGGNRITAFVNNGQLNAAVLSTDLTVSVTYQVGVTNPPPGGGASNTLPLVITNPPPSISSISPIAVVVPAPGGTGTTALTVIGNGYDMASQISFNGVPQTTTFVTPNQVTAVLNATDIATGGTFPIVVVNPAPGGGTSNPFGFSATPGASGLGLPSQVNVATSGVQANAGTTDTTTSGPVISANGQYMAFASAATNLFLGDNNNAADIFLHNTCLAVTSICTPGTILASASGLQTQTNGASSEPSMDASARFVAFASTATNLIPGNNLFTGTEEVYFRDTCTGITTTCTPFTILVSTPDGKTPANADSFQPSLSPDGRYVSYSSAATNLAGNSSGVQQIFLFDTCNGITGCGISTTLLSVATDNVTPGNGASQQSVLGNDALFVAFTSSATNLVSSSLPGTQQIFQRSTCVGQSGCTPVTQLASTPDGSTAANGNSFQPTMTQDGRIVAFASTATNLTSNTTGGTQQVFERDTCTGAAGCTPATSLVSVAPDGSTAGNAASEHPSLSPSNDQFVAFASFASNLVASDTNNLEDVFVRNTCAGVSGCTAATVLVSISAPQGTGPGVQGNGNSLSPALSGDEHSVAFISSATNLLPYPTADQSNVFLAFTTF